MADPANARRLDPGWMRELRHLATLGGWVHADYFSRDEYGLIRDDLLAASRIEPGVRDRAATFELTDAGWAWCRSDGQSG